MRRTRTTNDRIAVLTFGWGILFAVMAGRCLWLQVLGSRDYRTIADAQHWQTFNLPAKRGAIYDRDGRPLAVSVPAHSVFANAHQADDKATIAKQIGKAVNRDAKLIRRQLDKDRGFVWLARQVDPALTETVREFRRKGVGTIVESKRLYPQGRLASHLVGFVNIDHRGLEGLELGFNGILRGADGWRYTLRDARGAVLVGPWTTEIQPVDGFDVVLTIDSVVQEVAEETLAWGVKKYNAKGGSVIVMDPHTGSIWAMANWPTYDPNAPAGVKAESRRNRAITDTFEPGSTFKIVTASALLDEGRVTPEEPFFCENGNWHTIGSHILHDHHGHGTLSFSEVIQNSSNIGTSKAAQRLTPEELYHYIRAFGFGRRSGIGLPGEISGILHPPSRWSKLSPYIIPIGQEVAVTPIQLAGMVSIIANGGERVRPHLIERIQASDGRIVRSFGHSLRERVIRPETAETMQKILAGVVESGTGQLASVQGLTVAGKTGTAQKLEPNGRYSHSRFVASFVGFGPVPDPSFVIIVNIDEPRPLYFGGVVAAPIFKRIIERLAGYWDLPMAVPGFPGGTTADAGVPLSVLAPPDGEGI